MHERKKKKNPNKRFVVSWSAIVYNMLPTNSPLYMMIFWHSILCFSAARETIAANFNSSLITDGPDGGTTIVSAGGTFELGFFTPNGNLSKSRYVGIWYSKLLPKTFVWVANRDKPINGTGNSFVIADDGNLIVLDEMGEVYWSSEVDFSSSSSSSVSKTAKLMNSGNLVLSESGSGKILWESFKHPTDTFLPGMKMDSNEDLRLTSWKSLHDPGEGNFTFQIDDGGGVLSRRSELDKFTASVRNKIPPNISYFLSNSTISSNLKYTFARLVMGFDGKLQYFRHWNEEGDWYLYWLESKDQCSVFNACGNFGSCNLNNRFLCKCLPGFEPSSPDDWYSGFFSGGCTRKSQICGENGKDTFLRLKKMNVRNPDIKKIMSEEAECKHECLNNCNCQAYAYDEANTRRVGDSSTPAMCWIWNEVLNNLQEEYYGGRNFYARVALSDIEQTVRDCEPCGTNMIPYPLSTGPNCGDPMYSSFHCNNFTGHVSFQTPSGIYRVIDIYPETRTFFLKNADKCGARNYSGQILQLDNLLPFHAYERCNAGYFTSAMASESTDELELTWDPPLEPMCVSSGDCKDWPDSTCKAAQEGKKRCLCVPNFRWDNLKLKCTRVSEGGDTKQLAVSLIIAVTCSVFFLICLCCIIAYVFYARRRVSKRQGNVPALELYDGERNVEHLMKSGQFRDDEKKGIDVPFFDLETLLAATDNFSDANKLGQGGFGPVYKGKFSGGQEIAVKRLSSISGQGLQEFKNEVLLIAKLQHRNLVRLMGYCISGEEKMLLYEYMPNKSLDSFIFDRSLCMLLDWEMRFNIILGIARGLLYLHQDSRLRIIHRDLKTSNILLDKEMNPKISDFGLARIFGGKQTEAATDRIIGTYGYMSPEYALEGLFSDKSDVFSFGVVVLEIISGKRNTGYRSEQALSLLGNAWRLWKEEKALDLMDQTLHETCNSNELLKCVNVGLLCVQEDPSDRPTMSSVVLMLGSETATLPSPKQPAFVAWRALSITASSSSKPETSSSYNELSTTFEDGR